MSLIPIELVDPFDEVEMLDFFRDNYHFDLRKDLKATKLSKRDYLRILKDIRDDLQSLPINGDKVISSDNGAVSVYKFRYKDEARNIGSRGGYRIICLVICNFKAYPFHLYHKVSGRKPKTDLTSVEKTTLKIMVNDAANEMNS